MSSEHGQVSFGPFVFDEGTRQLSRGGEGIHLTPKAFELLQVLLEHRPRAVPKAVLHDRLWSGTFVADANLSILVAEVRAALGDSARQPMFIRTVHAFGYAFCGHVQSAVEPSDAEGGTSSACWLTSRTSHFLLRDGENVIGRDPQLHVWLDSRSISRRHARIVIVSGRATIEDLGSKNGTWVENQPVTASIPLADGNRIQLGKIVVTFRVFSDRESTETKGDGRKRV